MIIIQGDQKIFMRNKLLFFLNINVNEHITANEIDFYKNFSFGEFLDISKCTNNQLNCVIWFSEKA
jgi:hypothetical protein